MRRSEKFGSIWEKIPIGLINFLTILSSGITIITPIIGVIGLRKLYPHKNGVFIIFIVTVLVLVSMLIIVLRYMVKYKKLLMGARKASTAYFFSLTRNFRNTYFDILSYRKTDKLTVELLTEKVKVFLQRALDDICRIYQAYTYQEVCACIKYIDGFEEVDRETATIVTLVRSTTTDSKRSEYDNNNDHPIFIKDNTDFYSILSPNSSNKKPYFYQRNLVKYAEEAKKNGDSYNNTTKNWDNYYKATIVVPISIANKRLFFRNKSNCYNVIGFLCIDSLSTDAFLERDERYNRDIAQAFAAEIYIILNQYNYYLQKLTKKDGTENG